MVNIYTLSHPLTGEIRYVGKTIQTLERRLTTHLADARAKRYKNHNCNWIQSLLKQELLPKMELLDCIEDADNWEWLESYWISQLKDWGFRLTNLTDGGDGNKGQVFSRESIQKRADKNRGQKRTEEFKERHSKLLKGKPKTDKAKASIRAVVVKNQGRKVVQLQLETLEFIKEWECIVDAARFYRIDASSLANCCKGKYKKSAGYMWKYKEDYEFKDMTHTNGNVGE